MEPIAQLIDAPTTTRDPATTWFALAPPIPMSAPELLTRRATPPSPSTRPATSSGLVVSRSGPRRAIATSHSGTVATRRAVSPEGTYCAAQHTSPLPPTTMNTPEMVAALHSDGFGTGAPRRRDTTARITPAARKRVPPRRKGGIVSTPKRIARYVDPHTRYTAANANSRSLVEAVDPEAVDPAAVARAVKCGSVGRLSVGRAPS